MDGDVLLWGWDAWLALLCFRAWLVLVRVFWLLGWVHLVVLFRGYVVRWLGFMVLGWSVVVATLRWMMNLRV